MANGFCPSLLLHIDDVAQGNSPGRKMHVAGFLAALFCCQNSSVSALNAAYDGPQKRGLTVKYKRRPTLADVSDTDTCDIDRVPSYLEWNFPASNFKSSSFYISDETMQQYCRDAIALRGTGRPATQVMQEIYEEIVATANLLLKAINQDLVIEMATQFGENVTTGSATGKVINISRDGDKLILDNGIVDMLRDLEENEICDDVCLIGGGLWSAWDKTRLIACCNAAGIDLGRTGLPRFFFDKDTQSLWGQDSAAVLAPGTVKFIGRNKYTGPFAGQRGNSFFTTLPLPVNEFGCNNDDCLRDLVFDMQLRYIDCPTEVNINGAPTTVNRGWQAILSKEYNLWVQPTNAYASGDELEGTNGTLKYFLENVADTDASSPYPGY
jgi:hypothetical protein